MTEEIIIDGVNVKDCERRIGKNNFCRYFKRNCADNNYNCIWKKYLRLEQENSLLSYNLHIKEGEAEHYLKEVGKYRSALGEINKIAEPRFVNGLNEEADLCNLAMDRIQTKINEVLNDK